MNWSRRAQNVVRFLHSKSEGSGRVVEKQKKRLPIGGLASRSSVPWYLRNAGSTRILLPFEEAKDALREQATLDALPPSFQGSGPQMSSKGHVHPSTFMGMEIVFLGTSSGAPTLDRSTSGLALRMDGAIWLFDAGEGVQRQLQYAGVPFGAIERIFITHLHGDHVFGLPALLCAMANIEGEEPVDMSPLAYPRIQRRTTGGMHTKVPSVHVHGPEGIKHYLHWSLLTTYSPPIPESQVHELWMKFKENMVVYEDERYRVTSARLRHRVPCFGYVIEEKTMPGMLDVEKLLRMGLDKPGPICKTIKDGHPITLPNGRVVQPEEVMTAPKKGRKLVILGDTCDSESMVPVAMDADVVIHEATFLEDMRNECTRRGHSTARMAGEFARRIRAKNLILTHFSPRYQSGRRMEDWWNVDKHRSEREKEEDSTMTPVSPHQRHVRQLLFEARQGFRQNHVYVARDLYTFVVPRLHRQNLLVAHSSPMQTDQENT